MINSTETGHDDLNEVEPSALQFEYSRPVRPKHATILVCSRCHRKEWHILHARRRPLFWANVVLTLGLIFLVGPFICTCCGQKRWFRFYKNPNPKRQQSKRLSPTEMSTQEWRKSQNRYRMKRRWRRLTRPFRRLGAFVLRLLGGNRFRF